MESRNKNEQHILWVILTASIMGVSMLTSFLPVFANIPINVLLPIGIMLTCKMVFFEKLKLSTLIILRALILLAVFNILNRDIYMKIVLIFLAINIAEATWTDFKRKKIWNGITGILLTISVYFLQTEWIDLVNLAPFAHIYEANMVTVWGTILWIIAYTIWNWIFVTNEFSDSIARLHVGILLAPIFSCLLLWTPGYWLIFRANSLTFGGCVQIYGKEKLEVGLKSDSFSKFVNCTKTTSAQIVFMIVNIVLMVFSVML